MGIYTKMERGMDLVEGGKRTTRENKGEIHIIRILEIRA